MRVGTAKPRRPAKRRESGQAAVETAIIMPMYVFLVLGILQTGLSNQARLLTKYAAYMATRAGSLNHANIETMEKAALSVLLPIISKKRSDSTGAEIIAPVDSTSSYKDKWDWVKDNQQEEDSSLKIASVRICTPFQGLLSTSGGTTSNDDFDFDDPKQVKAATGWKSSQRSKLVSQVNYLYRMPIPFANQVLFQIWRVQETASVLRLGKVGSNRDRPESPNMDDHRDSGREDLFQQLTDLAENEDVFIMPIFATYAMRMQSNFRPKDLPEKNLCMIRFPKMGNEGADGNDAPADTSDPNDAPDP